MPVNDPDIRNLNRALEVSAVKRSSNGWQMLGALGSIPLLNRTLSKVVNFSSHPDWTLRVCDNFDWYAPRYQSHHTIDELKCWFAEEGFVDIIELPPARNGALYDWAYHHDLIIGSGVNVVGTRPYAVGRAQ